MLNYNKIHSSINFQRTAKSTLAKFMGIANSTLIDRLDKKNLTPDDVEKIADFFGKPIAYYFDREENEPKKYELTDEQRCVEDKGYCAGCAEKDAEINKWKDKYIYLLENGVPKKETKDATGKKAG